jgi:hypothetical protein
MAGLASCSSDSGPRAGASSPGEAGARLVRAVSGKNTAAESAVFAKDKGDCAPTNGNYTFPTVASHDRITTVSTRTGRSWHVALTVHYGRGSAAGITLEVIRDGGRYFVC